MWLIIQLNQLVQVRDTWVVFSYDWLLISRNLLQLIWVIASLTSSIWLRTSGGSNNGECALVINQLTHQSNQNNWCMYITRDTQLILEFKGTVLSTV